MLWDWTLPGLAWVEFQSFVYKGEKDNNYTSTTTSKAWPSIYSMHLPLQSRLKAFGGSVVLIIDSVSWYAWILTTLNVTSGF